MFHSFTSASASTAQRLVRRSRAPSPRAVEDRQFINDKSVFLAIATEIRIEIYKILLSIYCCSQILPPRQISKAYNSEANSEHSSDNYRKRHKDAILPCAFCIRHHKHIRDERVYPQILQVCRIIYSEASPLFLRHYPLSVKNIPDFADDFLMHAKPSMVQQIRHLEFSPVQWIELGFDVPSQHFQPNHGAHIRSIFEDWVELHSLDTCVIKMVKTGPRWFSINIPIGHESDQEYWKNDWELDMDTRNLWKYAVELAHGPLKRYAVVEDMMDYIHHSRDEECHDTPSMDSCSETCCITRIFQLTFSKCKDVWV
jgi:hypothetical protein